jgi:uncharacterized protein YgiM (DUF1202 family)
LSEWLFRKFTAMGDGAVYGVESNRIDLNYFNGDAEGFSQRFNVMVPEHPEPPDPAGNRYVVTAMALYVREGPVTNHKSLGYVQRDEIVEAFNATVDNTWRHVRRSDGLVGWSSARYMVIVNDA